MNKNRIRNAIDLWLPDGQEIDQETLDRYMQGQQAINDFLNLELTPKELTEFLGDVTKINVYHWLECCENNLAYV